MTSRDILQAAFLDLLFENRNKIYGAYALRKFYNRRLWLALCCALLLAGIVVIPVMILKQNRPVIFDDPLPDLELHTVTIAPELKLPPEKPAHPVRPPAPGAQQQFTQIRITADPLETTAVPTQADLLDAAISSRTVESTAVPEMPAAAQSITETGTLEKPIPSPADAEPQFPGGPAAWAAFLSRHLQAPASLEAGEKITVLVRFVVDATGAVTGYEIIKSGGAAFDEEVLRVLRRMPRWKPALRNGQPAAVPFTQPVTFIAMGE